MRLSEKERAAIKKIIANRDPKAEVYLYGSRTEDSLAGGDIDILVISEALAFPDKLDLLSEIKTALGDQKIDLSIKTLAQSRSDAFASEILKSALRI
jgi:predicted nucleotidyltransferase